MTEKITDQELIQRIWEKGRVAEGVDPQLARKDACGAWIFRRSFQNYDDLYGWGIDHKDPALRNSPEETEANLRPLHLLNIESKGDSYPSYFSAVTSKGLDNIASRRPMRVRIK